MNRNYVPVVTNLERQVTNQAPLNIFELAERMSAQAGPELDEVLSQAWAVRATIDGTIAEIHNGRQVPSLLAMETEDIVSLTHAVASDEAARLLDSVGYTPVVRASQWLTEKLEAELREVLPPFADEVVEHMRPAFEKHAAVITEAARQGIDRDTDPTQLVTTGTPAQIDAYRALPGAVAGLEQIAQLRDALTRTLHYGPRDLLGLAYVGPVKRVEDLETANIRYQPEVIDAQYQQDFMSSALVKVYADKVGGRWLNMVHAGLTLQLNTADQVAALRDAAAQKAA